MDAFKQILFMLDQLEPESAYLYAAKKLLANIHLVCQRSIGELAELCAVSQSTLSKLAKQLGFDSYSVFRLTIAISVCSVILVNLQL